MTALARKTCLISCQNRQLQKHQRICDVALRRYFGWGKQDKERKSIEHTSPSRQVSLSRNDKYKQRERKDQKSHIGKCRCCCPLEEAKHILKRFVRSAEFDVEPFHRAAENMMRRYGYDEKQPRDQHDNSCRM